MNAPLIAPPPQVFVRRIDIPPGSPWDQHRAARLEALHGAPLPADQLSTLVRRVGRWRARTPARFAAAYVRRSELARDFDFQATIDGQEVRFVFRDPRVAIARRAGVATTGLLVAAAICTLAYAIEAARATGAQNEQLLQRLEGAAAVRERALRRDRQAALEARLIRQAGAERRSFGDLTGDLAWLGRAKTSSAVIQRIRWRPGEMSLATVGKDPPVIGIDRRVEPTASDGALPEWRIGPAPAPVMRNGLVRPSVRATPATAP